MRQPEGHQGRIFNIQRFSLQDGPGLRTTVFLKGCPLTCAWCHNPESQVAAPEVVTFQPRCLQCGACDTACPQPGTPCRGCGSCVEACPTGARQRLGRDVEVVELARELQGDRIFFDQSGGGVTLSGGEPLMQPAFASALMSLLEAEGIHLAVDTCGFGRQQDLLTLARHARVVLFDLKLANSQRHEAATGVPNELILDNLKALSRCHQDIWIRVPIIPGVNDDDANLQATARIAAQTPGVRRVDLLPYHGSGASKFTRLGKTYAFQGMTTPTPERMQALADVFQAQGLTVSIGGRS